MCFLRECERVYGGLSYIFVPWPTVNTLCHNVREICIIYLLEIFSLILANFEFFRKPLSLGFPSFPSHSYCWFEFLFRENFLVFISWSSSQHHKLTTTKITTISSSLGSVVEYQHHHPHPHHPFMDVSTTHSPGGYLLATEWSWDFRNSAACPIHRKKM